jgi:glutamate-5-semialdehyde dehydrogenase
MDGLLQPVERLLRLDQRVGGSDRGRLSQPLACAIRSPALTPTVVAKPEVGSPRTVGSAERAQFGTPGGTGSGVPGGALLGVAMLPGFVVAELTRCSFCGTAPAAVPTCDPQPAAPRRKSAVAAAALVGRFRRGTCGAAWAARRGRRHGMDSPRRLVVVIDAGMEVVARGSAAKQGMGSLAGSGEAAIDGALRHMARLLEANVPALVAANKQDVGAGEAAGLGRGLLDRLRLDEERIGQMARQIELLAGAEYPAAAVQLNDLPEGLRLEERRKPIGVVGANFEARPNVTVDVASQLLKSRNAGVLRTGAAALRSAIALFDEVISPALAESGLDPGALQLVRTPDREAAVELVRQPRLIPLVILRGSGDTTRMLAAEAARCGVRTLAHADGGGVLYLDRGAATGDVERLVAASIDRLGVCNRLNLLLICAAVWDEMLPTVTRILAGAGVRPSLPPHDHPRGHEWALDTGHEATVTIDAVPGAAEAAEVANAETSGLAAGIVTSDPQAAATFLDAYRGTGAFWNASTRLLDGFKLHGVPETGINVDHVPGPRGPVTFRDLYLRQYVVVPSPSALAERVEVDNCP